MTMTSLLWRHLYLELSHSVHYFAEQFSFTTCCVLNSVAADERREQVQKANMLKRQTWPIHFSTYRPNSFNIYDITCQSDRTRESTAAIVASVVETRRQQGHSSSTTLSRPWANFLHQPCIAGLVKYLSRYTGVSKTEWRLHEVFRLPKTNDRTLFPTGCFQRQLSFIQCL